MWLPCQQLGQRGISILWQELYAINVACHLWGAHWTSKRIHFYCDNQGVVEVINSRRSKVPRVMDLVRDLTLCTLQHNFYFRAVHVPGINNNIADSLSRFHMERFHQLAPQANNFTTVELILPPPQCAAYRQLGFINALGSNDTCTFWLPANR